MAREYGKVAHQYWTGDTGKALRTHGRDVQLLGLYLVTNRHATMIGLYYLPLMLVSHETGLSLDEVTSALAHLRDEGYCQYDAAREVMWVREMARFQIGERLSAGDKRIPRIAEMLTEYQSSPLIRAFLARYQAAFRLPDAPQMPLGSPSEGASGGNFSQPDAPSMPHRCPIEGASESENTAADAPSMPGAGAEAENRSRNRDDDDSAQARATTESSSSETWTAGQLRTSVLELLDLWRQHGTGAPTPAVAALSGSEQRTLRDALKRRSLSEWEATFRRAKASAYLAGRDGTHAPMSLWRVLERASAIESGQFDARPVSGPREVPPSSRPELRDVSADIAAVQREQVLAAQERAARKAAAGGGAA